MRNMKASESAEAQIIGNVFWVGDGISKHQVKIVKSLGNPKGKAATEEFEVTPFPKDRQLTPFEKEEIATTGHLTVQKWELTNTPNYGEY